MRDSKGWSLRLLMVWAWWVLTCPMSALGADAHVTVQPISSASVSYDSHVGGVENIQVRAEVARAFYASHADAYDFLIVLPTFQASLGTDAAGLHIPVRNEVEGIGVGHYDRGTQFGSAARLKGYIDMGSLMSGHPSISVEEAAGVVAHEVAHQWSGRAKYRDPTTWEIKSDLIGRDGGHWSFFLDSDASVLYGSDWEARASGQYESVRSAYTPGAGRYSSLDLYLMGLLGPEEVQAPFVLLRPGVSVSYAPTSLPPEDKTLIAATPNFVSLDDIIQAMGPRKPAAAVSQKGFRAAFIILTAPGQTATEEQIQFVSDLRRVFSTRFFLLTQGRGVFETELLEVPAGGGVAGDAVSKGLDYLLARQEAGGAWEDRPETRLRDTQAALEALARMGLGSRVKAATEAGGSFLAKDSSGLGVDDAARRLLGLIAARQPSSAVTAAAALLRSQGDLTQGLGVGLLRGYEPTLIDSVLALRALRAAGALDSELVPLRDFLLARQAPDGGWAFLAGGPGRVESTAQMMLLLADSGSSSTFDGAIQKAVGFLATLRRPDGSYGDERPSAAGTAHALLALRRWGRLSSEEATQTLTALRTMQRADGSWEGSVLATARALATLREVQVPNLAAGLLFLSATQVEEGASVVATLTVRNTGLVAAENVPVRAYTLDGTPLGPPSFVPLLAPGSSVPLSVPVDTLGHAGLEQIALYIDPEGALDETREDDNGAVANLTVQPPPETPDLLVVAGSLSSEPLAVERVPSLLKVKATLRNLGMSPVQSVPVALLINGVSAGTTVATVGARSQTVVSLEGNVAAAPPSGVPIQVVVNPGHGVAEARYDNNAADAWVPVKPALDVRVAALSVTPGTVEQGEDVTLSFQLVNLGTADATSTSLEMTVETATGEKVATLPSQLLTVPAGNSAAPVARTLKWRANTSGALVARVRALPGHATLEDANPLDNTAQASFNVTASSYANLLVPPGALTLSPSQPLQGTRVTASVQVRNTGAVASGAFQLAFYLGAPQAGGTPFAVVPVQSLQPGETATSSASFSVEQAAATAVTVVLDSEKGVREFDESDNTATLSVEPVPFADLSVASGDIQPATLFPTSNTDVPVEVFVHNTGGQTAEDVKVALYLGAADGSVGTPIGTEQTVTLLAPGEDAKVTFSWPTGGLKGDQRLVAVVNADKRTKENDSEDNRAERILRVQDAALALSNPYFSPNGDGVKDATEVSYRLEAAVPVEVVVTTQAGALVRTLNASPVALGGTATWDGRDENGAVVKDGTYLVVVRSGTAQAKTEVGRLLAVVDNNRLPLTEDISPQLLMDEPLELAPDTSLRQRGREFAPDESGMYFIGERGSSDFCSFYFQPFEGGPPRQLASHEWPCDAEVSPHMRPKTPQNTGCCMTS